MLDGGDEPGGVVGPQDAPRRRILAARERRIVGLDEDDALGGDPGQTSLGSLTHDASHDPVGPVLDERRQRPLLSFPVVRGRS